MLFIFLLLFLWVVHRISLLLAEGFSHYILVFFLLVTGTLIPVGYLLSELNLTGSPGAWGVACSLFPILFYLGIKRKSEYVKLNLRESVKSAVSELREQFSALSMPQKLALGILAFAFFVTALINLVVLVVAYPNEWDSMTGHLVKCAYYIQNGNMNRLQGTSWTIDFYPNSLPSLQIFGYYLAGEKGFKLIHYFSYWMVAVSTYAISRKLTISRIGSFLAALIAALLPSALIQAVTTETDIVQSAYLGLVVFSLLQLKDRSDWKTIGLALLAVCVWISHKVTFMLIGPAVAVIGLYVIWGNKALRKRLPLSMVLFALGIGIYVLPNGYLANVKEVGELRLGALSAPPEVMNWHGIEHYSSSEKLLNFQLNLVRYSSDFLQLDGIRNTQWGEEVNEVFRRIPNSLFSRFNPERNQFWVVFPFEMMGNRQMGFFVERPYWGIISFALVLPVAVWLLFRFFGNRKREPEWTLPVLFLLAAGLHFASLSYSAPYDPIKGRYFMNMAVWCLPLLGYLLNWRKAGIYLLICSAIIALTALLTLTHRNLYPLSGKESIFRTSRVEQLTITRPEFTDSYQKFEELVPADARVAVACQQEHEDYIYPLWGKEFQRHITPLHPFRSKTVKPIPSGTDFLFYSEGVIPYREGDILLGKGDQTPDTPVPESKFYLRKLVK